jgi:hypothetical protein
MADYAYANPQHELALNMRLARIRRRMAQQVPCCGAWYCSNTFKKMDDPVVFGRCAFISQSEE